MCGICGIAFAHGDRGSDPEIVHRMTQIIRHRGPDDNGFYIKPGIRMGVRRLSIVDLKTGNQPISSEDESVTLVCNGEIYNFVELRQQLEKQGHRFRSRSDAEVIIHLYEEYGARCLDRLRGMFAFALWDEKKRQLLLARDRLGIKPLYYATACDGALYFGSEMKSILIADAVQRKIDPQAFKDLFALGFVLSPKTLFATVKRLQPAQYLLYRDGSYTLHKYWQLSFPERGKRTIRLSAGEWAEALRAKIEDSVKIHLAGDVPVGAWLSGGIDSSAIVSLMTKFASNPVQTFSLGFEEYSRFDEVTHKKSLADFPEYPIANSRVEFKKHHFNLFTKYLWHREEPVSSVVGLCQMVLSETTSRSYKVVLTGEGADEIFGGYPWYTLDKILRPFAKLPLQVRRFLLLGPLLPKWKPLASQVFLAPHEMNLPRYAKLLGLAHPEVVQCLLSERMKINLQNCIEPYSAFIGAEDRKQWHPFAQLQHVDTTTRLADFINTNLDRLTMAHAVEARVPFLDHELVELCAHIPPALKMRGLREKYILRQAMRKHLPAVVLKRKKRGLGAPAGAWLRGKLPEFAMEMLSDRSLRQKDYFDAAAARRVLSLHRSGQADYTRILVTILSVQSWDELFVQGCRPSDWTGPGSAPQRVI